jgi:hypothetical protein
MLALKSSIKKIRTKPSSNAHPRPQNPVILENANDRPKNDVLDNFTYDTAKGLLKMLKLNYMGSPGDIFRR